MIRLKYFWPLLCCLLLAMVCYQGARIENQQFNMDSLQFDLKIEKMKISRYDSMLNDCEDAIKQTTTVLKGMNDSLTEPKP